MHEGVSRCMALRERLPPGTPLDQEAALAYACGRLGAVTSRADVFDSRCVALSSYIGRWKTPADLRRPDHLGGKCGGTGLPRRSRTGGSGSNPDRTSRFSARTAGRLRVGPATLAQEDGRLQEALDSVVQQVALYREAGNEAAEMMAIGNVAHCELCLGRLADAEAHSRAALARLDAIGSPGHGGHIGCVLALTLVLQDKSREALEAAALAWPHLRAEGDEIRLLPVAALAAAQQGRLRQACRVMGCIAAVTARLDLVRPARRVRRGCRLERLLDSVPEEQREREIAYGATLDMEAVFAQAGRPGLSGLNVRDEPDSGRFRTVKYFPAAFRDRSDMPPRSSTAATSQPTNPECP